MELCDHGCCGWGVQGEPLQDRRGAPITVPNRDGDCIVPAPHPRSHLDEVVEGEVAIEGRLLLPGEPEVRAGDGDVDGELLGLEEVLEVGDLP